VTTEAIDTSGKTRIKVRGKRQRQGESASTNNREQSGVKKRNPTNSEVIKALELMGRSIAGAKEIQQFLNKEISVVGSALVKQLKAGKSLDRTGVGAPVILIGLAAAMIRTQRLWRQTSLNNRVKLIGWDVNKALTLAGVPKLLSFGAEKMDIAGYFQPALWNIRVSKTPLIGGALSDAAAVELCDTGMHEACHAEQRFLAACYYAGLRPNTSAKDVARKIGIPISIAQAAAAKKFNANTPPGVAARGKEMYEAFVINGKANQKISDDCYSAKLKMDSARIEADNAKKALKANPTYATFADHETKRKNLEAATL
jgi:hypothetical protein